MCFNESVENVAAGQVRQTRVRSLHPTRAATARKGKKEGFFTSLYVCLCLNDAYDNSGQ
jgi:hypothetical protein